MDTAEINHLIEGEEFDDSKLQMCLLMALDAYNTTITPISINSTLSTFPSMSLMIEGGAVFALKSSIFKYIRNAFGYNDAGVQVSVEEKSAEYERTLQRMLTEWNEKCMRLKEHINLEGCYGGFSSEYLNIYIVGRRTRKI